MPLAIRVLVGLVSGFLLGLAIAGSSSAPATAIVAFLTTVGAVFVNLIRMTVIPLVVSMLIGSVGGLKESGGLGKTGVRALLISIALVAIAATGSVLIAGPILARIPLDQAAALALKGGGAGTAPSAAATSGSRQLTQWVVDLVPSNVAKAAADGAMLPLILFAVIFGIALTRVSVARRAAVLHVIDAIAETMQLLVGWILWLAPIGVFSLAVPLASRLGLSAAGAVVGYIAVVVTLTIVAVVVVLYPLGIVAGPLSPAAFISYCAPAQAIAFAARSSLAALPVAVQSAERARLPESAARVFLPMSVSVFHFGAAIAQTVGVLFLAKLFGVTLTPLQLCTIVVAVVFASYAVPGIPGGSILAMVPVLAAVDLPIEGVGILLAVDTIPDMFRTTANLTGAMTLTAILREAGAS
jgi:proton glutamate symport protein